ncbi:MAG TPA: 2-phospho-L-lactate guanylyltransferase [Solirubrobacteraceae bacterium]|nr:2-phospho-L-lactate guanylyltransferase [Solirubrobacteraceae bacterium]
MGALSTPRTAAVLPVKRLDAAHRRLEGMLSPATRRALAQAMARDVLLALGRSPRVDEVVVVSPDPVVQAIARSGGARVVAESREAGHSHAALLGVAALDGGVDRVLLVAGDCPTLDPAELDALLDRPAPPGGEVVVVPDRHGTGTNALLLAPPGAIEPAFGAGSRARHERRAAQAGVACEVRAPGTLMLDVDTPDDLAALGSALDGARGRGAHTRALLDRLAS